MRALMACESALLVRIRTAFFVDLSRVWQEIKATAHALNKYLN